MDNPVLQKILENTFTLGILHHRLRFLREAILYKVFARRDYLTQDAVDLNWLNSLGEPFFKQFNKDNVDKLFEGLELYIQNLKPLIIYFASPPSDVIIIQTGLWLRKNCPSHQIFDAKIDPNLVAGTALSLNGVYKDYSLRVKIAAEKEKILASFKKFLS